MFKFILLSILLTGDCSVQVSYWFGISQIKKETFRTDTSSGATNSIKFKDTTNYLNYHTKFSKIERQIASENFKEAQADLEKLFRDYEVKFVKDYVIAAQIALVNKDKRNSLIWLRQAIKKGATLACLKEIEIIRTAVSTNDWEEIAIEYDQLRKVYLASIDLKLLSNFSKRYADEQQAKRTNLYQAIVQSNFDYIKHLIKLEEYPGENRVGVDNEKVASSIDACYFGNSKVTVTLLHYDYPISEIGESQLIACIKKGNLHPREFAHIYNYEKSKVSVLYQKSKKEYEPLNDYKFNFPFGEKHENIRRVNMDRALFGICKYEVDLKIEKIEKKYGLKLRFGYK